MRDLFRSIFFLFLLLLGATTVWSASKKDCSIRIATYNLRLHTPDDKENAWPLRSQRVRDLIQYHRFDIFGTQEGFIDQLHDLEAMPEYAHIGLGRDDGKEAGEHAAIFYRTDRFRLLDHGTFWLSESPDIPSFGWGARFRRICTWGQFRDKITGRIFYLMNAHFDHESVLARRESAHMMIARAKALTQGRYPVFLLGDFNATPSDEPIQILGEVFRNAYDIVEQKPYGPVGTYQGFRIGRAPRSRIDHVFVNDKVRVLTYAALSDWNGVNYPSDHLPVVIDAVLSK